MMYGREMEVFGDLGKGQRMSSDANSRQRAHRTGGLNEKCPFFMCETVKIAPFKIHKSL